MRIFYEPTTLAIAVAATTLASGVASGIASKNEADAAADDVAEQQRRDIRDEDRQRRRLLARQRAALASQGVELEEGQGLLAETNRESFLRQGRIRSDAGARRRSLGRQGTSAVVQGFIGGASRGGQSLLAGGSV